MSNTSYFPAEPRVALAVRRAAALLLELDVQVLPLDPFSVARNCGWRLQSFTAAADRLQLSLGEFRTTAASHDAFTAHRRRPVIFYDDTRLSDERIAFSLCHEFGHIALNHFTDFRHIKPDTEQLRLLEREASIFAANLLAPPAVAAAIAPEKRQRCRKIFGMSQAAWQQRLASLEMDLSLLAAEKRVAQLQQFDGWMHTVRCRNCGRTFRHTAGSTCPTCDSNQLLWNPHGYADRVMFPQQFGSLIRSIPTQAGRNGSMLTADIENPMVID